MPLAANPGPPRVRLGQPGEVWAFDVDGTLIGSIRSNVLRPGAPELLAHLRAGGVTCVLWSAGGDDYARRMAVAHRIDEWFAAFHAKRERSHDARYTVGHFGRQHRPDVFVDDAPNDLPASSTVMEVPQFMGGNPADRALWNLLAQLERGATPGRDRVTTIR